MPSAPASTPEPLSPGNVPSPGARRDAYLEALAVRLMPTPEAGDCYFTAKGRDALVGFLHYLAVACDDNSSRAPRKPKPSIRGLADWMAAIMRPPETDIARRLRGLASIVRPANDNPNSSQHAFVQFATLAAMAEKERSGVLGTVSRALAPFKGDRPPARS